MENKSEQMLLSQFQVTFNHSLASLCSFWNPAAAVCAGGVKAKGKVSKLTLSNLEMWKLF